MRIGVLLPHRGVIIQSARRPPVEDCWTIARLCDAADMDVWVGDSVVAKPRLEPLTWRLFKRQVDALVLGKGERLKRAQNPLFINGLKLTCHNTFIVQVGEGCLKLCDLLIFGADERT